VSLKSCGAFHVILSWDYPYFSPLMKSSEDEQTRIFGFRAAHVFGRQSDRRRAAAGVSQVKGDPGDVLDWLKSFTVDNEIVLEYKDRIKPARGMSSGTISRCCPACRRAPSHRNGLVSR